MVGLVRARLFRTRDLVCMHDARFERLKAVQPEFLRILQFRERSAWACVCGTSLAMSQPLVVWLGQEGNARCRLTKKKILDLLAERNDSRNSHILPSPRCDPDWIGRRVSQSHYGIGTPANQGATRIRVRGRLCPYVEHDLEGV